MISGLKAAIRPVEDRDQQRLANLMHFEMYVHRHLDWRSPLEWIQEQPFLVAERDGALVAALASPIDPPGVAWIRLFAVSSGLSYETMWETLWLEAQEHVTRKGGERVVAIALQKWFGDLLERSQFNHCQDVVFLMWQNTSGLEMPETPPIRIRPMEDDDLEEVARVDSAAFGPVWQNSISSLSAALYQAHFATVVEGKGGIVGYQISTASEMGGHLARLAIHPSAQHHNIGTALLIHTLRQFESDRIDRVTVNTQQDNLVSLRLYEKVGFHRTGEAYKVYQYFLKPE